MSFGRRNYLNMVLDANPSGVALVDVELLAQSNVARFASPDKQGPIKSSLKKKRVPVSPFIATN